MTNIKRLTISSLLSGMLILLTLLACLPAFAGLSIAPTQVQLKSETGFGFITVTNQGLEPVNYAVKLPAELEDEFMISPRTFSISPSESRIVRFKLKDPSQLDKVLEQRVLLEQQMQSHPVAGVVQIRMNFSLPIRQP